MARPTEVTWWAFDSFLFTYVHRLRSPIGIIPDDIWFLQTHFIGSFITPQMTSCKGSCKPETAWPETVIAQNKRGSFYLTGHRYCNNGKRVFIKRTENEERSGCPVPVIYGQLKFAEDNGASGILFFTDPADFTLAEDPRVYPDSWWLPPSGVHRGTVFLGEGDPLTPGYPSIGFVLLSSSVSHLATFYFFLAWWSHPKQDWLQQRKCFQNCKPTLSN